MRKLRICLYGSTDLKGMPTGLVSALAEQILMDLPAVIVTGGFVRGLDRPEAVSTDWAAMVGAQRVADRRSVDLGTLFEAWIPEGRFDGHRGVGDTVRMTEDQGVKIKVVSGRTALGRRLSMVADVDVVVTVAGAAHTEVVLEQAIELGVPVLPLRHTGGQSEKLYRSYRPRIDDMFAPGAVTRCFEALDDLDLHEADDESLAAAARAVVDVIKTARTRRCLVLQQYGAGGEKLYDGVIRPAVEQHMRAVRLKDIGASRQISASFVEAVTDSAAIIVDITELNQNVMYEVGYAHGQGVEPLLFTLNPSVMRDLPVYIRSLSVHAVSENDLPRLIDDHLRTVKRRREDPRPAS